MTLQSGDRARIRADLVDLDIARHDELEPVGLAASDIVDARALVRTEHALFGVDDVVDATRWHEARDGRPREPIRTTSSITLLGEGHMHGRDGCVSARPTGPGRHRVVR